MTNVVVDVLLGLGVAGELLCCLGVLVMRTAADRLHFAAAGSTVPPLFLLAALLVREGVAAQGLMAIGAVGLLFLLAPVVVHATGRAILDGEGGA
jgi:multisubunit Na+/H+ antiporter MnhG subunit